MRKVLVAGLLGLAPLLAGCPESIHPVSDPAEADHDAALFGVWRGTFDGDEVYLHVGAGERGMTHAVLVEHKQRGGAPQVERYAAFPTRLGKLRLLNVRRTDEAGAGRDYAIMKYQVDGKNLTLWMTSYAVVREDIKAGKLEGKAGDGPLGETRITASSEELARYFEEGDARRLFDKPLPFRRLR